MSATEPSDEWSYKVSFWKTEIREGKRKTVHLVRWTVDGKHNEFKKPFSTSTLAESFRSDLVSAARKGEPFHITKGLPASMLRETKTVVSWYEHACAYADMKWPDSAPKSRVGVAETLANVTPVLLATQNGATDSDALRKALYTWSFRTGVRVTGNPPAEPSDELAKVVRWVQKNTLPVTAFEDPAITRAALDAISKKLDGTRAADKTIARKRAVLHAALEYGVELGYFATNPLKKISKKAPKVSETVDPAALPDRRRGKALLAAVEKQGKPGPRLVAYFACIYYAAMRPAEVSALCSTDFIPPKKPGGWGEFRLRRSAPTVAAEWTDSRSGRRETRQLKHRAKKDFRVVPCHPVLAAILAKHIKDFGVAPDGRLFRGARGGPVSDSVTGIIWQQARAEALSEEEFEEGVAVRPYDLRHACVTGWLNAGVDPAQVADWAGHSVAVLLRVYVRCIVGRDEIARKRIEAAFTEEENEAEEAEDPEQEDPQEDDDE
jgi:integrase